MDQSHNDPPHFESLPLPQDALELPQGEHGPEVRRVWDHEAQAWYYSVIDFVKILTLAPNPTTYWGTFKKRHAKDSNMQDILKSIKVIPLRAKDGKLRETECVTRQTMLRIVQSIPSKQAERVRLWLAEIGEEKLAELEQEDQAKILYDQYVQEGRTPSWAETRVRNLLGRNALTDEWLARGAQQTLHFGKLTSTLHTRTFAITPEHHHRHIKQLPKSVRNPRDHYTEEELGVLTLAELAARRRHEENESQGFPQLLQDVQVAGDFGKTVRQELEKAIGRPVVSEQNFLSKPKGKKKLPRISPQKTLFEATEVDQHQPDEK